MPEGFSNPALTVGLALGAGVVAQVLSRHLQMPGIVVLLVAGVLLGPDVAGVIQPVGLGEAMQMLVGFAVAVILFEGGMHLDLRRLRKEALVIRRLVTIGAVLTAAGGAFAARLIMGWEWDLSILFGTLVIVTGPTVVTPLLRRLRLKESVSTVLEAEGVLIDPIGAIIAVVALEFLYAQGIEAANPAGHAAMVLGTGAVIGLIGGLGIGMVLRPRWLVPSGYANILVLASVIALFQVSEAVQAESGLAAVTTAGIAVGNIKTRVTRDLLDFKEQLTVLMIGLLFVLLAADVRLRDVQALGWPAIWTVAALMLVVRPAQAFLCTWGAKMDWRERVFIATLAPRGIVAAAVASLFAQQLALRGDVTGGEELRGLVFLVIAATVTIHGLTGGTIAKLLGLRRPQENGYVVLGANALGRALGEVLRDDGHEVVFIDSNVNRALNAEADGYTVIYGQGLQSDVITRAETESRIGCIAITPNDEVNLLFASHVRDETRAPALFVTLREAFGSVQPQNVHNVGATVLFGGSYPIERWIDVFTRGAARVEMWRRSSMPSNVPPDQAPRDVTDREAAPLLMLAVRRRGRMRPFDDETQLAAKEEIAVAISNAGSEEATAWLTERGWTPVEKPGRQLVEQTG